MDVICDQGKTALRYIFSSSYRSRDDLKSIEELTELLLEGGADPNKTSSNPSESPCLNSAAEKGSLRLVELLLKNGASVSTCDYQQRNALHMACKNIRGEAYFFGIRQIHAVQEKLVYSTSSSYRRGIKNLSLIVFPHIFMYMYN